MSDYQQDPNVPKYGTPEYAEWYQRNVNPQWGQPPQPPKKKRHIARWLFTGLGGIVAVIVVVAVATAGNGKTTGKVNNAARTQADKITHPKTGHTRDSQLDQPPSDAPTSDDNSNSDTAMGTPIGQTITVTETEFDGSKDITDVTVNSVSSHSHAGDDPAPEFDPKNGRYAVVNVTVKCVQGNCAYNELYFGWQEADGTTYSNDDGNGIYNGYEPALGSGDLHPGQIKRGNVGFDVPLTVGAQITLSSTDDTEVGSWK